VVNILPTKQNLTHRGVPTEAVCSLCAQEDEFVVCGLFIEE